MVSVVSTRHVRSSNGSEGCGPDGSSDFRMLRFQWFQDRVVVPMVPVVSTSVINRVR